MEDNIPFTQEFVLAVALDWAPIDEICADNGVTEEHYERLKSYKPFQDAVAAMKKVLLEDGVTSSLKAKVAVEGLLPDVYRLAKSEETPPSVRLAAFQHLTKIAGLDKDSGGGAGGFTLQIMFDDGGPRPVQQIVVNQGATSQPSLTNADFLAGLPDGDD